MKKYLTMMGMGIAAALVLTACSGKKEGVKVDAVKETKQELQLAEPKEESQAEAVYVKLTPEEAKSRIDSGDTIVIVDVRTPEEYGGSRIGNAINIPVDDINTEMPEELPDSDAEILVYCRSGVRSKKAAEKLLELGYKNVKDIGGIIDWPYETVAGDGAE